MISGFLRAVKEFHRDRRGAALFLITAALPMIFGMAAVGVDLGYVFYIKGRLQTAADLGALAAGKHLLSDTDANVVSTGSKIALLNLPAEWKTGGLNGAVNASVQVTTGCLTTAPFSSGDCTFAVSSKNAVRVTATATVPLLFASALGYNNAPLTATSLVGSGNSPPLNIVLVMDTTASMNSNTTACGSTMTRQDCAMMGVRGMLATLWPSVAKISLMVYPGLKSGYPAYDYCGTSGTIPDTPNGGVYYNASPAPIYWIVKDSTDYRLNPTSIPPGAVNTASNLAKAMAVSGSGCAGIQNVSGSGTYYADNITQAQAKLVADIAALKTGDPVPQNVIILLSDGDAGTTKGSFAVTNQCQKAIDAANTAAAATPNATWVYSIAYNASTSLPNSSCATDSAKTTSGVNMSACETMKEIASDDSKFYSVDTTCNAGTNSGITDLTTIFKAVATSLMKTRRVSEAITK